MSVSKELRAKLNKLRKEEAELERQYLRTKFENHIKTFAEAISDGMFLDIVSEKQLSIDDVKLLAKLLNSSLMGFYQHAEGKLLLERERRLQRRNSRKENDSYASASNDAVSAEATNEVDLSNEKSQRQY